MVHITILHIKNGNEYLCGSSPLKEYKSLISAHMFCILSLIAMDSEQTKISWNMASINTNT